MGILDDAIREHLDLKRRRGADPSEVDRLEREALGPVRRAPQEPADLIDDKEQAPAGAYPFDEDTASAGGYPSEEELPGWADSPEEFEPYDRAVEPSADEPARPRGMPQAPEHDLDRASPGDYELEPEPDQGPRARHHQIAEEWEAHGRGELPGEPAGLEPDLPAPAPPAPPVSADRAPDAGSEFEETTAEYRLEDEHAVDGPEGDGPREGEDVLEETPDFLQDTPDHDRLWFEQRPPRDFDFDG